MYFSFDSLLGVLKKEIAYNTVTQNSFVPIIPHEQFGAPAVYDLCQFH